MKSLLVLLLAVPSIAETIVKEYGPFTLEPKTLMIMPSERVAVKLPAGRLITAIEMRSTADGGKALDCGYICHNNFGPNYRKFNHGRKALLDGYTPRIELAPGFGMALQSRDFLAELMYNNPDEAPITGVRTRLTIELAPKGAKLKALYPQMMSVFEQPAHVDPGNWGYYVPARSKDTKRRQFDLLEDFTVHHVSFHIHEYGQRILLRNVTTGETLCDVRPVYEKGLMKSMPQVSLTQGARLKKGQRLELLVEYDNPLPVFIDTMGAAMLFGRCPGAKPDCDAVAQREADNAWFDPKIYASLLTPAAEKTPAHHHH
jgi:hypothetical protein